MTASRPPLSELARVFGRIGLISFGGPAAQIALMHRELVDEREWLSERDYLGALSFCMLLPGPEAMQLATYAGWKLHGTRGGLIAGGLFVLPGALVVLGLAMLYVTYGDLPLVQAMFLGIKAAVVAIIVQALLRVAGKSLASPLHWTIAGASFIALFAGDIPFPLILAAAALTGVLAAQAGPTRAPPPMPDLGATLRTVAVWAALWAAPLIPLWAAGAEMLTDLALFFAQLAVVSFGGAYAVLAYLTQTVVVEFGWLTTAQMMDGLGLAETTPGPLILVTEFVGFLAGHGEGGLRIGLLAAAVTLWMTFIPCFLWIFAGAPYLDWISGQPRLASALEAISAAVVGVILSLSVWFAAHVFFAEVGRLTAGPFALPWPDPGTWSWQATALAAIAAVLLFTFRLPLPGVLAIMAGLGGLLHVGL